MKIQSNYIIISMDIKYKLLVYCNNEYTIYIKFIILTNK